MKTARHLVLSLALLSALLASTPSASAARGDFRTSRTIRTKSTEPAAEVLPVAPRPAGRDHFEQLFWIYAMAGQWVQMYQTRLYIAMLYPPLG